MSPEPFARVETLMRAWRLEEATALLEAERARPGAPNRVHHDLSVLYAQQGLFAEALASIETAMAHDPRHRALWHHFLAIQKNNPDQPTPAQWRAMHLAFGDTVRERFDARHLSAPRPRDADRKLRIGYLSPDTHNATERFVWPALEHFDRSGFEVFAYWSQPVLAASAPGRFPDVAHRSLAGLDDDAIVVTLLADRIDVVVDVAGHGAGNALPALAARAAPIQMTWLDYLATTGLETVDYRITDAVADPSGAEAAHLESLLRLPVPQWCYRPPGDAPAVIAASTPGQGPVFGSVCVPLKLSDPLLDLWARLLDRVPESRLRFLGIPEGRARERIIRRFQAAGVDALRIEMRPRLSAEAFFREVADLDVVLDSHPFSGATSSLDALWMGTPVVTLPGPLSHSRSTASILSALGREAWIAGDAGDYVEIAARLAAERASLGSGRARLRADLAASSLCDGPGFARALEAGYRSAWRKWLAATAGTPVASASANETADACLLHPAQGPQPDAEPLTERTRSLAGALPSHREASQAFWREFRELAAPPQPSVALASLAGDWTLITRGTFYRADSIAASIPAHLLDRCDVLGALGADALHRGDILAAGRGHVAGVLAYAEDGSDRVYCDLYLPRHLEPCVVLAGPALLVRTSLLDGRDLSWRAAASEVDFRAGLTTLSARLHQGGARLGICTALAMIERATRVDAAAERRAQQEIGRAVGCAPWTQRFVAASPLRAALPQAAWATLRPRFARICDSD